MTELTTLGRFVKRSMLRYPSIFPDRLHVLAHAFLVLGNGIEIGYTLREGGSNKKVPEDQMDFSDLDERLEKWMEMRESWPEEMKIQARADIQKDIDIERAFRQRTFERIDELANTPDYTTVWNYDIGYHESRKPENRHLAVGHYERAWNVVNYGGWINLWNMPISAEQSTFDGAIEIMSAVIRSEENYLAVTTDERWEEIRKFWLDDTKTRRSKKDPCMPKESLMLALDTLKAKRDEMLVRRKVWKETGRVPAEPKRKSRAKTSS